MFEQDESLAKSDITYIEEGDVTVDVSLFEREEDMSDDDEEDKGRRNDVRAERIGCAGACLDAAILAARQDVAAGEDHRRHGPFVAEHRRHERSAPTDSIPTRPAARSNSRIEENARASLGQPNGNRVRPPSVRPLAHGSGEEGRSRHDLRDEREARAIGRRVALFASWNGRTRRSSAPWSRREISFTSCRTIRASCTTSMYGRAHCRAHPGPAPVLAGGNVVDEHVAADEHGRLQLDALGRHVAQGAGREVDAVDAVLRRAAAAAALQRALKLAPDDHGRLALRLGEWRDRAAEACLSGYRETMTDARLWPDDPWAAQRLIDFFMLERAIYEIDHDAAHLADRLRFPLTAILRKLSQQPSDT